MNRAEREHQAYLRGKADALRQLELARDARFYARMQFVSDWVPAIGLSVLCAVVVGLFVWLLVTFFGIALTELRPALETRVWSW